MMDDINGTIDVSVIVTTYNRKEMLDATLRSIFAQTYQNFELIVVDNYSDYDFCGLIDSYKSEKIQAYQNHNNGVIAVNRNFAIKRAKGKYLAFCDDDDLWLPNKLELQVQYMESHDVDIIGTALILFGEEVEEEKVLYYRYIHEYEYYCYNYVTPSTVMVKNTADIVFDETPSINCAEDWAMWMALYIQGYKLYQMPEPLVKYRLTSQNLTKTNRDNVYLRGARILWKLRKKFGNRFQSNYFMKGLLYQYRMYLHVKYVFPIYKRTLRPLIKKDNI